MSVLDAFLSTWSNARSTFGDGVPQTGAQYDSGGKLIDMKMDVVERSVAVLVGMTCGYVFWLAGITALTVIVPMQHIIIAGAVFLGLITTTAFALATHFKQSKRRHVSLAFWWAATLPAVASVYSLIVFLN